VIFGVDRQHGESECSGSNRYSANAVARGQCLFCAAAWTVARKTQVFHENPGFNRPPAAGLGNSDPAHVSEHRAFSQAAGTGSRRAVALAPPQPFDAGASQTKGM